MRKENTPRGIPILLTPTWIPGGLPKKGGPAGLCLLSHIRVWSPVQGSCLHAALAGLTDSRKEVWNVQPPSRQATAGREIGTDAFMDPTGIYGVDSVCQATCWTLGDKCGPCTQTVFGCLGDLNKRIPACYPSSSACFDSLSRLRAWT